MPFRLHRCALCRNHRLSRRGIFVNPHGVTSNDTIKRGPGETEVAIKDGVVAGVPVRGRRRGAGNTLVGDADAHGRHLDTVPERSAGPGRLQGAFGHGRRCAGGRRDHCEPDVWDRLLSLRAVEDRAGTDAGAAGDDIAGDAGRAASAKKASGRLESKRGRAASQVAANLGIAAIASNLLVQSWLIEEWLGTQPGRSNDLFAVGLAALAEAAADTVSSELGQVLSGYPRMITTLRKAEPGTDGAISVGGTTAGIAAAGIVSAAGAWATNGGMLTLEISWAAGVFGLFFDSLLGATLERRGWLNNDAVNFLSTASAAGFALGFLALMPNH